MKKNILSLNFNILIFLLFLTLLGFAEEDKISKTSQRPLSAKQNVEIAKKNTPFEKKQESKNTKSESDEETTKIDKETARLSLKDCIDIALKNNHFRKVSKFSLEIAEAQHKQALSSYWPEVKLRSTATEMEKDIVNVTPAETVATKNTAYVTLPDFTTILSGPIYSIVSADVPETERKVRGKRNIDTSLTLTYPLYTGGIREAIIRQTLDGLDAAKHEVKRTDLEVIYDVKRMYYGAILADKLLKIAKNAYEQMKATLDLTETMYKSGSGKVKKTDYLRNKIAVDTLRSMVAFLESNELIAKAALVNSMGMDWDTTIELSEDEIPFKPYEVNLKDLVGDSYQFNPDYAKLKAGLDAAEAKIRESKGGYLPKVACFGSVLRTDNSYKYGIVNRENNRSWVVGVSVEVPIFDGFLTQNKIREARANLKRMEEQKILLELGLALQVKHLFLKMHGLEQQEQSNKEAAQAAEENSQLNVRAYQDGLVESKDVIESQLIESFMKAQYQKALYDYYEAQARLDYVIGEEVSQMLGGKS